MAKGEDSHTEIARVRQKDGINVIFDRSSAAASRSRSRSKSSRRSSGSGRHRGRSNRRHRRCSSSSSSSRHSRHRRNRSRSSRSGRAVSRFSQSPPRNHRSSSGSEYSENSVDLSIDDKGNPIMSANASIIQEDEKLYSPEIVESIQSAQAVESNQVLRETWVRQDLEKTPSQIT